MPIETNLNQSPYFDDYSEEKNFHRVLFRPGYAVQARELTQMQTILQNQVERFASDIFVDGSVVEGVGITLDPQLSYVKMRDKDANNRVLLLGDFYSGGAIANAIVEGQTTGVLAQLIDAKEGSEAAAPDYLSIFVKYLNSGANNTTKTFSDDETLVVRYASNNGFIVAGNTITSSATGYGFRASVTDGIVYQKGHFVRVEPQSIVVSKFDTKPSAKLGFQTVESIVDSYQDSSLLDNASGSTNYSAPGANRLKLTPTLAVRSLADSSNTATFFSVGRIVDGNLVKRENAEDSRYSDLNDYISKRIYETNGNYAVEPFNVRIREHLKSSENLGKYVNGDYNKLVIEVESGVGYVSGNRVSVGATYPVVVDKATDYIVKEEAIVGQTIGNYIVVNELCGPWNFDQLTTVSLRSASASAVANNTLGTTAAAGSEIGTAKVRGIQWDSGTSGTPTGQFRIYLTETKMNAGYSFSDVRGAYVDGTPKSHADLVLEGGVAKLKETNLNTLVFPLNQGGGTKTLKGGASAVNTQFVFREQSSVNFDASGTGTATLATAHAGGNESMNDTGTLSAADRRNVIIVANAADETSIHAGTITASNTAVTGSNTIFLTDYQPGDFIKEAGGGTIRQIVSIASDTSLAVDASWTISAQNHSTYIPAGFVFDLTNRGSITSSITNTQHDIDLGITGTLSGFNASVYYNVVRTSAIETAKVVNKNKFVKINTDTHSASKNGPWSLGVSDVYKIVAVYKGSNTGVSTSDVDVTDQFDLDSGMKDAFYDTATLKKKSNSTLDLTNSGLLVKFNYFTRDYSAGIGYLSVDSYPVDDATPDAADKIATYEIPVFTSPSTGRTYDLRNSVDFRPIKASTATPNAAEGSAPINPALSTTFAIESEGVYSPTPDENFQADMQIYLPRKDRIAMTAAGEVIAIKGIPSLSPKTPDEKVDTMTIATLEIPPYPSLSPYSGRVSARKDYQVRMSVENNRRYTMKDLRAVEDRVKRIEYYSSLNALEASAKNKQLINDSGLTRFKNGFLVDNFDGHNVADINNTAYKVAIDRGNTVLRPSFKQSTVPLQLSTDLASTNTTKIGDLLMMNYTQTPFIDQPFASKKRNCVQELTFNWTGEVVLNPDADNINDITQAPEVQIDFDGIYSAIETIAARTGVTGTDWGNWRTTATRSTTTSTGRDLVTTTTNTQTDQLRFGVQTSISPSFENFSLGNLVTDVAVRDFMRSRVIQFTGQRMRPSTRVYPYFDGEKVDAYCTPATSAFANTGAPGSALVTDSEGFVYGYFRIPNDNNLKFRVGTKKFELLDIENTTTEASLVTTSASSEYTSIGLDVTQQGTSISIKTPQIRDGGVVESRTVSTISSRTVWAGDPICQSFFVSVPVEGSAGTYITKLDLYFAKKSSTLPVTVQIREMENGVPTNTIVPFGSKTLSSASVNVNATTPSTATTFTFDSPVFLNNNAEYCFVVLPGGNSNDYVIWTSELGGTDLTTNAIIDKQPESGVMFVSANDRTWNAIQSEDIKYTLHRANFATNTSTFYMENENMDFFTVDNRQLTFEPGEKIYAESVLTFANNDSVQVGDIVQSYAAKNGTVGGNFANGVIREIVTSGSGSVTVKVDNYGVFPTTTSSNTNNLYVGSTWIGNTTAFSANAASGFVTFFNNNTQQLHISRSTGSFANGYIRGQVSGASARVVSVDDIPLNAIVPKLPTVSYANTSVKFSVRTTSTSGVISSSYVDVDNAIETEFIDAEKKVYSYSNESALSAVGGSKKSLVIRGVITSNTPYVSPVIDTSRLNTFVIGNDINNDSTGETSDKGDAEARYMSRPVVLEDGQDAEDLVVYLSAYKPRNTDISVYARILNGEDPQSINDKDFTLLTQVTSADTYSDPVNRNDFKEFEYTFSANTNGDNFLGSNDDNQAKLNTANSDIVAYRSSDGSIYHTYKTFAIKIVLTSAGTNIVPLVNDMRAIALQK